MYLRYVTFVPVGLPGYAPKGFSNLNHVVLIPMA